MLEQNIRYFTYQPSDTANVVISIIAILFAIFFIVYMIKLIREYGFLCVCMETGLCVLIVGLLFCLSIGTMAYTHEKKVYGEERLTYTVYLDGQVVDLDKIDIRQYRVTCNDSSKEIYLTGKGT